MRKTGSETSTGQEKCQSVYSDPIHLEFINHAASQQRLEFPTSANTCRRGIRNAAPPALRRGNGLSLAIVRTYAPPRRHEAGNFP